MPIGGWYHATKHALEVLSDTLRMETQPFGIRLVVIQPGQIESEWSEIAAETLKASSRESVYADQVDPIVRVLSAYSPAAKPTVVAISVSKAVNSRSPRRRYAIPMDAKLLTFLHWLLPNWAWEPLIRNAIQ